MKRKYLIITFIFLVLILIVISPLYYPLRSYIIIVPYSYKTNLDTGLNKLNVDLDIKGGLSTKKRDWYPYVLYHKADDGFSRYNGKDLSLTILYNFGHFESNGTSSYYNPNSPYYSSFYGGYVIYNKENPDKPYGFNDDGSINYDEISLIPKYDQTNLVLPSLGYPSNKVVFENEITNMVENVNYIGMDGWTKIDGTIVTNSPLHKSKNHQRGYIQYGKPNDKHYTEEDFPIINLKGRVYVNYIEEHKITLVLYILAPSIKTIDECDNNILSKSKIEAKD